MIYILAVAQHHSLAALLADKVEGDVTCTGERFAQATLIVAGRYSNHARSIVGSESMTVKYPQPGSCGIRLQYGRTATQGQSSDESGHKHPGLKLDLVCNLGHACRHLLSLAHWKARVCETSPTQSSLETVQ